MKRKKLIIGGIILIAAVGIIAAVKTGYGAEVDMFTLKKGNIQSYLELRGKVELDNKRKIYSQISGTVESINIKEGDLVDEKTELLSMGTRDLDLALEKSQAAFDASKAAAEEVKRSVRPEQIEQAEAQLEQAKAGLDAAEKDYAYKQDKLDKVKELYNNNALAQQDLKDAEILADSSLSSVRDMEQRVKTAKSNLDLLKEGAVKEAVDAAEANARQNGLQVEDSRNNLDRAKIQSDIRGIVLSKYVSEGDAVQPGTALFEVGDCSSAYISASVLSDDAVNIKQGQKAILSGDVLKDKKIVGEVFYIAPKAVGSVSTLGIEQQRVEVRIKFDGTGSSLKPGYGVDVNIITGEKESALYVPDKAVFQISRKDSIFLVKDSKLVLRSVKKGIGNNDYIEITEGLSEGDTVVVDPDNSLKPGTRVKKGK